MEFIQIADVINNDELSGDQLAKLTEILCGVYGAHEVKMIAEMHISEMSSSSANHSAPGTAQPEKPDEDS